MVVRLPKRNYLVALVMNRAVLHTIVCLILAFLYIMERQMPCMDECTQQPNDPCAEVVIDHTDDDDHHDSKQPLSHCDHCTCPCHIPAIKPVHAAVPFSSTGTICFSSITVSIPTALVSIPDHIPLV
jgi:hypothetical protein